MIWRIHNTPPEITTKQIVDAYFEWQYKSGLTMQQAAKVIQVAPSTLSMIGTRELLPSGETLKRMLKVLDRANERNT
jgi:transcriptional regulator with XRE-family HTH domain